MWRNTILGQIVQILSRKEFGKIVAKHDGEVIQQKRYSMLWTVASRNRLRALTTFYRTQKYPDAEQYACL